MLLYKDLEAGYCTVCEIVANVVCPNCKSGSTTHHWEGHYNSAEILFSVPRPLATTIHDNLVWTKITCKKCDFVFNVPVHGTSHHE